MNGTRVRIPFDGEMLTFVEVAQRVGLSPSRVAVLHYQGRVIARVSPLAPRRAEFDGEMLTAAEIAKRTGLSAKTIGERMRLGRPVQGSRRGPREVLYPHEGELMTAGAIANAIGKTKSFVVYRLKRGLPLDDSVRLGRRRKERDPLTQSGVRLIGSGAGENGLRWHEDDECLFWHLWHGGDGYGECTLEEIGRLWDLSRERIRQICEEALCKIKRAAERGDKDALNAVEFFRARAAQRSREPLDHWEQAALNAPGNIELSDWSESTPTAEIARMFGDEAYANSPHLKAAQRGGVNGGDVKRSCKEPA